VIGARLCVCVRVRVCVCVCTRSCVRLDTHGRYDKIKEHLAHLPFVSVKRKRHMRSLVSNSVPAPYDTLQMARTQKNKATMGHLGLLKARLAKLKRELIEPKGGGGGAAGEGFDVAKTGDARIGFVGELKYESRFVSSKVY